MTCGVGLRVGPASPVKNSFEGVSLIHAWGGIFPWRGVCSCCCCRLCASAWSSRPAGSICPSVPLWTVPSLLDKPCPHAAAGSNASGLMPPGLPLQTHPFKG